MIVMHVDVSNLIPAAIGNVDAIRKAMIQTLGKEGDEIEKLFNQTTRHWQKDKFDGFKKQPKTTQNVHSVTVGTTDRIYAFINYGTSKRYAILSGNWVSQTSPNSIISQPGQGRVLARGKKAVPVAMPGIDARNFDESIVKKRQPIFIRNIRTAAFAASRAS